MEFSINLTKTTLVSFERIGKLNFKTVKLDGKYINKKKQIQISRLNPVQKTSLKHTREGKKALKVCRNISGKRRRCNTEIVRPIITYGTVARSNRPGLANTKANISK